MKVSAIMDRVRSAGDAIVTNDMAYFSLLALSKRLGHLHFIVVDGEGQITDYFTHTARDRQ